MVISSTQAAAIVKESMFGGLYTSTYDHTDSNGNFAIHVTDAGGATMDWVYVNPNNGNYNTLGGYAGSLFAPSEIVIPVSFTSPGNVSSLTANVSFPAGLFIEPPVVTPGNIVQTVPYCDVMSYPFIENVTATGCTIIVHTALHNSDMFGAGTLIMNFKVSDRK